MGERDGEQDADLRAFRDAWLREQDGPSGRRYAEALDAAGRLGEAVEVCERMWELGYVAGYTDAAWLEHDAGRLPEAIARMQEAIAYLEGEDRRSAAGIVGSWLWEAGDGAAEGWLRAGLADHPEARPDLAALLAATDRGDEGERLLEEGVAAGAVLCMLPLANLRDEQGRGGEAEALYRRAFAAGDAYSAWNLALLLERQGRTAEAADWRWRAAQGGDEVAIRALTDGLG
ncbi:hypothetical protein QDR37_14735 [Amnibacterium sp. CER49]|uniref:hypothetical protein n=1 Tax=Amnibacterium sp. CER49 TaxID=3039161 RepID=UPI0024499B96|nr:hypothetical protein [Amnibacterium sp. CER49]MDH2445206.1 hypothetical protein [Amnibacterium sp. CER49]